ncbi:uncharacterized protein LOC113790500 [Dermatophagoides pteronyssinus]|uniref:uncharacterized protein LOC113790500 n=1 Tax=Dermatophagoides pteronyssinus TaxID=6956 RepID=UPI003F675EFD
MSYPFKINNLSVLIIMFNMIIIPSHSAPVKFTNISISMEMNSFPTQLTNQVINHKLIQLNNSEHELIKVNDDSPNDFNEFLIFGIHTYKNRNVSLCRWQNPKSILMNGTNFGVAFGRDKRYHRPYSTCLYNPNIDPLNVLLIENRYSSIYAPVPGGCNIEFPLEISPFIYIRPTNFPLINYLTFQHAALGNETDWKYQCGQESRNQIEYLIYAHTDDNDDNDETEYFHRLILMSNYDWIATHCWLIARINPNQSPLRLYFSFNSKQTIYFNIIARLKNEAAQNDLIHWSLYVPSHNLDNINKHSESVDIVFIIVLVFMGILSTIVSLIGYRYFIFEIFFFAFILVFAFTISLLTTISSKWHPHNSNQSYHCQYENLIYAFIISMIIASIWTIFCRYTRNLRLALSLHSIVLSFWLMATLFNVYVLSYGSYSFEYNNENQNLELFLNIAFVFGVLVFHLTMFYFIDLFWMSALSTSLITVYLQLLPFDCCFLLKNYSLFRITYNLWLYNNYHIIRVYPFVNLINLTKNDLLTFILFLFITSLSIAWQLWSKIGNISYGFACITTNIPATLLIEKASTISSSPSSVKTFNSKDTIKQNRYRRKNHHNHHRKYRSKILYGLRKPNNDNKKQTNGQQHKRKYYRCKYCHKISDNPNSTKSINRQIKNFG